MSKETVKDHIYDRLASAAQRKFIGNASEAAAVENGILLYLQENGIDPQETRAYFLGYVDDDLSKVDDADLKAYFISYPQISRVRQIAIEYKEVGHVTKGEIKELYHLLEDLNEAGLGATYVPITEIKGILGRYA